MEKLIRLLPFARALGADNMAGDEAMLHSASDGLASLRFYTWSEATVSLGYFQSAQVRECDSLLKALPFVRRPTGGATLVHHHELTYALALPPAFIGLEPWLLRMHRLIAGVLKSVGVSCEVVLPSPTPAGAKGVLCFRQFTPGDVLCRGAKIVGSAQRKARRCLLQHGAILLQRSSFAPVLPGIKELSGVALDMEHLMEAIQAALAHDTGWPLLPGDWSLTEIATAHLLKKSRYEAPTWNRKR